MSDYFANRKAGTGDLFKQAHQTSDVDEESTSQHHTLGSQPTQAAPGNHKHKEYHSKAKDVTTIGLSGVGSGYWTFANTRLTRRGDVVELDIELNCVVAAAGNVDSFFMPAEHAPVSNRNKYFWGLDSATGGAVALYLTPTGTIRHVFSRSVGQVTVGFIHYIAVS